jgi:hypothetical protein
MKTHVEFRSDEFPPYDGEEDQTNPGCCGKRVLEFLSLGLNDKGFEPLELIAEDWGWMLPIKNDGFSLWIGCGNYGGTLGDDDGCFLCFIEPHRKTIRPFPFLWKVDTSAKVMALREAIDQLLSADPSVKNKRWWTYEEFMTPAQRAPISLDEIQSLIRASESLMAVTEQRLWDLARIRPAKWRQDPWGKKIGGFWVVGILGELAIWYNDIEEGFNISHYTTYGTIDEYCCNQDTLHDVISGLSHQIETGIGRGRFGPPEPPLKIDPSQQC